MVSLSCLASVIFSFLLLSFIVYGVEAGKEYDETIFLFTHHIVYLVSQFHTSAISGYYP